MTRLTVADFQDWELAEASLMVDWGVIQRMTHCPVCQDDSYHRWCRVGAATILLRKIKKGGAPYSIESNKIMGAG